MKITILTSESTEVVIKEANAIPLAAAAAPERPPVQFSNAKDNNVTLEFRPAN